MKQVWLTVMLAACGSDKVHHLADAPPEGSGADARSPDARAADAAPDAFACGGACCTADQCPSSAYVCSAEHQCVNVTGNLDSLLWKLPCNTDASATVCNTDAARTVMTTLGGTAGVTYDVTVHLRGVVEQKTYSGGCASGLWLSGGANNGDTYNVYRLTISSPPQTYFLNQGASGHQYSDTLDYVQTFRADAGATVQLYADAIDGQEIKNVSQTDGTPLVVAGVPDTVIAQPYNGQFIAMEVQSVVPDPIATASTGTGTPGHALQLAGGQQVAIADSASLDGATSAMTVEAWATFDAATGAYNAIACKPYGTGSVDSVCLWHQSGALDAGIDLDSPSGAATTPLAIDAGVWHHYAMTYDGASTRTTLYVDGQAVSCVTGQAAPVFDAHPLLLGADIDNGSPNGFWSGALDEVRVFATARTPDQVWADMHAHQLGPTAGLVGEWTFDEGTGQTTADTSGAGNPGVLGATSAAEASDPTWIVSTVPH